MLKLDEKKDRCRLLQWIYKITGKVWTDSLSDKFDLKITNFSTHHAFECDVLDITIVLQWITLLKVQWNCFYNSFWQFLIKVRWVCGVDEVKINKMLGLSFLWQFKYLTHLQHCYTGLIFHNVFEYEVGFPNLKACTSFSPCKLLHIIYTTDKWGVNFNTKEGGFNQLNLVWTMLNTFKTHKGIATTVHIRKWMVETVTWHFSACIQTIY